ncbi:MAG: DUF4156 domain-containing protein [Moraxellaceae bacterium]|nr:MAG: DUF4156 domain-containing protein [Moraxellaceae bacterium]
MKKLSFVMITMAVIASGCTWVKVSEKGGSVAVANAANVRGCENIREVTVSVTSKVGFVKRNSDKVATELANLARNEAVNFGGDTVVPSTTIENGRQSFNVYKCNKK